MLLAFIFFHNYWDGKVLGKAHFLGESYRKQDFGLDRGIAVGQEHFF
jgi:hypothetical protein